MEDQGKRLLLAVMAAFGVMLVWNLLFPPPEQSREDSKPETSETRDAGGATGDQSEQDRPPAPGPGPKPVELAEPDQGRTADIEVPRDQEELFEFDFPRFKATFSSYGGSLRSWELKGEKYREKAGEKSPQIELVPTGDDELLRPFIVHFADVKWEDKTEWKGRKKSDTEVVFTWAYRVPDADGSAVVAFELTKTFKFYPDDYLMELTIDVVNKASKDEKQAVVVSLYGFQDLDADTGGGWTRVDSSWKSACYVNGDTSSKSAKSLSNGGKKLRSGKVRWGGLVHSYFLLAAAPRLDTAAQMDCNSYGIEGKPGVMQTDIVFPVANMRRGGSVSTHVLLAYFGPKYLDKLDAIPDVAGFDPGFDNAIDLGWFEFIARPLLWLLQWFHSFLGNWGLAIIFLTVVVKLATLYWTTKSMRSMKQMAKLAPQIKALQKKYKDDKQRLQAETMNLYKAHNVNPLAGCLPMLLQMPIWFALYRMLMKAAELYHAPFITGWINDLTATDPYYILPIGLMVLMFVQARLSPTTANTTQQKIMMYGMPLMFGVFSFFFPSGLTLYICTNTILTAFHHIWMNRTDPSRKADKTSSAGGKSSSEDDKSSSEMSDTPVEESSSSEDVAAPDTSEKKRKNGQGKKSRGRRQGRKGGKRGRGKS